MNVFVLDRYFVGEILMMVLMDITKFQIKRIFVFLQIGLIGGT